MISTILFLCPHGAAKSVIAAAYWNRLAEQHHIPVTADAAGTEPDETVSPAAVKLLRVEGIDVSGHQPRRVTHDELEAPLRVISMGCSLDDLMIPPERVEQWSDIPAVSQNPVEAAEVIRGRVEELMARLKRKSPNSEGCDHDDDKNWLR